MKRRGGTGEECQEAYQRFKATELAREGKIQKKEINLCQMKESSAKSLIKQRPKKNSVSAKHEYIFHTFNYLLSSYINRNIYQCQNSSNELYI